VRPDASNVCADNESVVDVIDEMESFEMRDGSGVVGACQKNNQCCQKMIDPVAMVNIIKNKIK
jgi:hypothetical protein